MSVEKILTGLAKVKKTGHNKWKACCPAHADKVPSLAIKETEDGQILLHCFSGCSIAEILSALSLSFSDLYPDRLKTEHSLAPVRRRWSATDVLHALAYEVLIASECAKQLSSGNPLSHSDQLRLLQCIARLQRGLELIHE